MAVDSGERKRKRKRKRRKKKHDNRKLLPGEKVEVLYTDEGLNGSWHSGIVINCGERSRFIEYTDLLSEDDCSKLVELIPVSAAIEGLTARTPKNHRGRIRPSPPNYEINISEIKYGLCVDALVDDAWWEGVVFDHKGGSTERLIFFPDQGDQQMITIDRLRLTHEWNEVSGHWKSRGDWLLLQVLQTFEQEDALPVSTREIWYDLRTTAAFSDKIGVWTLGSLSIWHSLVLELIQELLSVSGPVPPNQLVDVPMTFSAINIRTEGFPSLHGSDLQKDDAGMHTVLAVNVNDFHCSDMRTPDDHSLSDRSPRGKCANRHCPQEATKYRIEEVSKGWVYGEGALSLSGWNDPNKKQRLRPQTLSDSVYENHNTVVHHPPYLGEISNGTCQMAKSQLSAGRKFSGGDCGSRYNVYGKHSSSSIKACGTCKEIDYHNTINHGGAKNHLICKDHGAEADSNLENKENSDGSSTALGAAKSWQPLDLEAAYFPEAITLCAYGLENGEQQLKRSEVTDHSISNERLKAKKHMLALGWKIEAKRDDRATLRMRFLSPEGKCYHSVHKACCSLLMGHQKKDWNRKNDKNTDGGCLSSNTYELLPAKFHPEPAYLQHDCPAKKKKCQTEDSSHVVRQFVVNEDAKSKRIQIEKFRPFSKKVNSDDLSDSGIIENLSHEFLRDDTHTNHTKTGNGNMVLKLSERVSPMYENLEPGYFPEAVLGYKNYMDSLRGKGKWDSSGADATMMRLNAKKHLKFMGWRFQTKVQTRKGELVYASPSGKSYRSLYLACDAYMEEEKEIPRNCSTRSLKVMYTSKRIQHLSTNDKFEDSIVKNPLCRACNPLTAITSNEFQEAAEVSHKGAGKGSTNLSSISELRKIVLCKLHSDGERKSKKSWTTSPFSSISRAALGDRLLKLPSGRSSICQKSKKRKASQALVRQGHGLGSRSSPRVPCSIKRSRQMVVGTPSHHAARTVLSLLIENDMILPRQKVCYIRKRDGHVMMEGRVARDGIKCKCCKNVYSLSNFEAHAGSNNRRPAANIFLQDGRSLLQCQMQMVHRIKPEGFQHPRRKSNYSLCKSDTICSVCHDGGSLVLCDHCPSSFHLGCVGLEDVPKGKWFCPSCRCGICGLSEFNSDTEQFTEKTVLYCDQCEHEYHVGCLRKRGFAKLSCPIGNWFCSKKCSKIFLHLRKLLGKPKQTAEEGLSWTILRSNRENGDSKQFDAETIAEHDSKLCVALNVLHECFVTMIEPRTRSDFVADLLFNKESELNRLNFYGFYTMLLERGDELISVATFRVYGEKVAEIPLVGTRVKYRRQGMCRLLMNELEKLLSALGVERLLLPAVPQLLETWTGSFGFSKMSSSDRLNILEYTVLNFQDTTMCQKLLRTAPTVSAKPKSDCKELTARASRSTEKVDSEIYSIVSDVVEMVEPINMLPSLGTETCPLPAEADNFEQISSTSNCTDLVGMNSQMPINIVPDKCKNSSASVEMAPTVMVKPSTDHNFKFLGICYRRIGKTGTSSRHLINYDRGLTTFKYFYRRRISASKEPCSFE